MKNALPFAIKAVPIAKMRVNRNAQRELRQGRVDELAANFNLDVLGYPTVNERDGHFYIVDGQHRIEAYKRWSSTWEKEKLDCRVYTGMTEREEADMFDRLDNVLAVASFDKFRVRVMAGRPTETIAARTVEKAGLKISRSSDDNAISAVGVLVRVLNRSDDKTLLRTLTIAHQSFGGPGLTSPVVDGMAYVCQRYNGKLDDAQAIERLGSMRGGVGALMTKAEVLRKQTGKQLSQCVAAAIVDTLNGKRGGNKLPSWWAEAGE